MKFIAVAIASLAAIVVASPVDLVERQVSPGICSGLSGTPQCCATDVLGVADLDCATPPAGPITSAAQFNAVCARLGQRARCCAIPILSQGVICAAPN